MRLELGVCAVRDWRLGDAAALVRHVNDPRIRRDLGDDLPQPATLRAAARFILVTQGERPRTCFAITVGGESVGGIGYRFPGRLGRFDAEIGYWVAVPWWGRGIATAALRAATAHAFRAEPELRRIYALSFVGNPASAGVLEKAGYRMEGRLRRSALRDGVLVDQLLHAILREDCEPSAA
jgi:ribosomal-protein-alanine N-acetyltransferase